MRLNPQYHSCRSCCEIWAMLHPGAQPESACEVFHPILQRADGGRDCQNCTATSTAPWAPNFEERWMWKADKTWWGTNGIMAFRKSSDVESLLSTQSESLDCLVTCSKVETQIKVIWVILDFVTFWQWYWPNGCNGPRNLAMKVLPRAESFVRTQPGALARRNLSTILLLKMRLPNEDRHAIIQEIVSRSWQDEGFDFALFSNHLFFLSSSSGTRCAFGSISSPQKQRNVHLLHQNAQGKSTRANPRWRSASTVSVWNWRGQGLHCQKCLKTSLKSFGLGLIRVSLLAGFFAEIEWLKSETLGKVELLSLLPSMNEDTVLSLHNAMQASRQNCTGVIDKELISRLAKRFKEDGCLMKTWELLLANCTGDIDDCTQAAAVVLTAFIDRLDVDVSTLSSELLNQASVYLDQDEAITFAKDFFGNELGISTSPWPSKGSAKILTELAFRLFGDDDVLRDEKLQMLVKAYGIDSEDVSTRKSLRSQLHHCILHSETDLAGVDVEEVFLKLSLEDKEEISRAARPLQDLLWVPWKENESVSQKLLQPLKLRHAGAYSYMVHLQPFFRTTIIDKQNMFMWYVASRKWCCPFLCFDDKLVISS